MRNLETNLIRKLNISKRTKVNKKVSFFVDANYINIIREIAQIVTNSDISI